MQCFRKTVFLMIPAFIFVSFFATSAFAGKKGWKKHDYKEWIHGKRKHQRDWEREYRSDWRDEVRNSHGHHHHDCKLPPGLAKKGKVPPGWAKKCRHQEVKHHRKHQEHYPDHEHERRSGSHDHKRSSGGHDKPTIEGGVDIGVGIHIPFP
jgi:hypothetical protein